MPFEISPEFKPTIEPLRVGLFQDFADAMLRGCALTGACRNTLMDGNRTCALGAAIVGFGRDPWMGWGALGDIATAVDTAYSVRYGTIIAADNDEGRFTREEIAARIAAL